MVWDGPYGLAYRRYMETMFTGYKKITANGHVRRGRLGKAARCDIRPQPIRF